MKKRIAFAVVLVAVLAIASYTYFTAGTSGDENGLEWGKDDLSAAARSYYIHAMTRTVETWQEDARNAEQDVSTGRLAEPYRTYLVFDTTKPAMWIEKDGRALPETFLDLPEGLTWTLYHSRPEGTSELGGLVRLQIRGRYTKRLFPEMLHLSGYRDGTGHIGVNFRAVSCGSSSGSGRLVLKTQGLERKEGVNCYESLVVSDSQYAARQRLPAETAAVRRHPEGANQTDPFGLQANLANWRKVEKRLYQEMEQQMLQAGYPLQSVDVREGPDYTSAGAKVSGRRRGRGFGLVRRGPSSIETYLRIDYLGQGVWYAKSGAHPQISSNPRGTVDLEFLVCAVEEIAEEEREAWLEKGREKQLPCPTAPSPWQVTLANGVRIEFIGICESPSAGKQWWGPDGSPLERAPYCNTRYLLRPRSDRSVFEIAWRVSRPNRGKGRSSTRSSLERSAGSGYRPILDRYGNTRHDIHAEGYTFGKSRTKTALNYSIKIENEEYYGVTFKNISLVPGQDPGFTIELDKDAAGP